MERKLPEGWKWVELGQVGEWVGGGTPSKAISAHWSMGTIPWVSPKDMISLTISDSQDKITELGLRNSSTKIIHSGSLLFVVRSGILRKVLPVAISEVDLSINQDLKALVPHEGIDAKYLLYSVLNFNNDIRRSCSKEGTTVESINISMLKSYKIPLPPLETQQRIVAILDKAEETRRLRAQADEVARRLIQSFFFDMFGNIEENSMEWKKAKIGDVVKESRYGLSKKANENGTYPILGMNNITYEGNLDFTNLNYIDLDFNEYNKYKLETGDILFNRTNAENLVGKTAIFKEKIPFVYASYLIRLNLNGNLIAPEFFWVYLNLPMMKKTFTNRSKKAVNQANINAQELKRFDILLPPIEIQQRFCDIMKRIQDITPSQKKSGEMINQLFISLMQKAFNGELVA